MEQIASDALWMVFGLAAQCAIGATVLGIVNVVFWLGDLLEDS